MVSIRAGTPVKSGPAAMFPGAPETTADVGLGTGFLIEARGTYVVTTYKIASDLNVSAAVHFLEGISRRELSACYARADIFALPSTGEGFVFVFLEAMAFGKPLVGARAGGATDLIEDGVNGLLVPPHDQGALAQAIERLLRDDSLRATLGQKGAEIVRRKYRFDAFEKGLSTILAECGLDVAGVDSGISA